MRISDATLQSLLVQAGKVKPSQFELLKAEQEKTGQNLQTLVLKNELITENELGQLYANQIGIPFITLDPKTISRETINQLPERIARQYNVVLFGLKDGQKLLAMEDPDDVQAVDFIKKYLGSNYRLHLATHDNVLVALDQYRGEIGSELTKVFGKQTKDAATVAQQAAASEADLSEDSPTAKTVNLLLEYAIRSGASDVHIEPRDDYVQVRYRVDGVLREANRLPRGVLDAIVSRIKILSNLKIDERRVPQDGRFKIEVAGKLFALRVSTLPITEGEKVVMRILDESNKAQTLEQLGFWGSNLASMANSIVQPHGMVLVTGPTGSGKSTTLYSVLSLLNKPSVNISTVEDPVEYKIAGVNQTQVNPKAGMTFTTGLRALLRQDPNIIMVGEIRDSETADLGVQAALTGHLVFSTLHTNNAATCLPRLLDMGIEPFLIASTTRAVVGQRLARRLCDICRQSYQPQPAERDSILATFHIRTGADVERLRQLEVKAREIGIGKNVEGSALDDKTLVRIWRANPAGCDNCGHSGYKGRLGIYEVLPMSASIQKLIVGRAISSVIQEQATAEGMMTMQMDGFVKSLLGQTSIEEILRVTRE